MKTENDVLFGNTAIDQFESDAAFGAVMVNPDFAVFDVEVQNATVDPAFVGPADSSES